MIKIERTPTPPASLAIEKNKNSGSYRNPDVIALLRRDFHDKCYICELNELQSVEVEHLKPHHGDKELKFDWNNLFYSCAHCNSVKNTPQYDNAILDCCLVDPEEVLLQKLENGHVVVVPLVEDKKVSMTAQLVTECFEKSNTGIRLIECETRVNALRKTMNLLYKTLADYEKSRNKRSLNILHGMLDREYKFAAFTRNYVREHLEQYPYLEEYI